MFRVYGLGINVWDIVGDRVRVRVMVRVRVRVKVNVRVRVEDS